MENRPADKATEGPDKRIQAKREKFTRTPLTGKPAAQLSGGEAPPARREHKAGDLKEGDKPDKKADRMENSGTEKDKKGDRDAPAVTNKGRDEKAPGPAKQGEQSRKADRPEKVESDKGNEPRQEKKQPAPREISPKKEPNPEPKPERATPEKPQERQQRKEGSKKKDKDQNPDEKKGD